MYLQDDSFNVHIDPKSIEYINVSRDQNKTQATDTIDQHKIIKVYQSEYLSIIVT